MPKFWSVSLSDRQFLRGKAVENWKNKKCTEWPQTDLEHLKDQSTLYTQNTYTPPPFSRYKVVENREKVHRSRKNSEWPWTLTDQKYPVYNSTKCSPSRSNLWYVSLCGHWFRETRLSKIDKKVHKWPQNDLEHLTVKRALYTVGIYWEMQKCIQWPENDLEHLSAKSTMYALSTHTKGPTFSPFRSKTSRFQGTRLMKFGNIGNVLNDLKLTLKFDSVKGPYTLSTYSRGPNFCPSRSMTNPFRDTALMKIEKSETYWMTSDWLWTLNS